jgi:predicted phage terminase large subunit-like protein
VTITSAQQAAARELLRRRRALESMVGFRDYMASTGAADFQHAPARHHLLMIRELERLERGESQRLLILAPPGSAKSTYCSIQYPLWRLARRPSENILCAGNTQDLAEQFNRRRRNVALSAEWHTLAEVKLAADLQGAGHFGTEREGGIRAAGVSSAVVGFRSTLNVLDDPIRGIEEALSRTTLDKQWEWFNSEFRTRLVPDGKELIVSTRWARNDIAGRILALIGEGKEHWSVLRLPMVADSDHDALGRQPGDILWPEYFTPDHVERKQQNVLLWSTQFQQVPLDNSGSWIGAEHIEYVDGPTEELQPIIAVDLALSVGKGDWTVFVVAGVDSKRRLHILDVLRARTSPEESARNLYDLCERYRPAEVLIDNDNASKVFSRLVMAIGQATGRSPPPILPQPMRGRDKETRAAAIRGLFLAGTVRVCRRGWNAALHHELVSFPSGDHDDQIDALGLIGRRYPSMSRPIFDGQNEDGQVETGHPDAAGRSYTGANLQNMFEDRERSLRRKRS